MTTVSNQVGVPLTLRDRFARRFTQLQAGLIAYGVSMA